VEEISRANIYALMESIPIWGNLSNEESCFFNVQELLEGQGSIESFWPWRMEIIWPVSRQQLFVIFGILNVKIES
jgi:hypothetical protein